MFSYLLWIRTLVRRIQLDSHCEIRDSTSELTSAMIHSTTHVVCHGHVGISGDGSIEEVISIIEVLRSIVFSFECPHSV
jgi:hypothetical protein